MNDIKIYKKAMIKALEKNNGKGINGWYKGIVEDIDESMSVFVIDENSHFADIFSHAFAKAFWGEEITSIDPFGKYGFDGDCQTCLIRLPAWQYHLQQMVLEENPLEYLSKFLD